MRGRCGADRDRPVPGVHDQGPCGDQRVRVGEGGADIGRREQVDRAGEVLLQLVLVHPVDVDALQEALAHEGRQLAAVEPRVLVVDEGLGREAPHRRDEIVEPRREQSGILHRVEARHQECRRVGEGVTEAGRDRHLAVRGVVREDDAVRRPRRHRPVDQTHRRRFGVLHDEVRVEGVVRGRRDDAHRRGQQTPHVVVDAHEMLHRGHADAVEGDPRAHPRPAEGDGLVEVRGEGLHDLRRQHEALASPAGGEEGEHGDDERPLVDDRRRGGQLVDTDAVALGEG